MGEGRGSTGLIVYFDSSALARVLLEDEPNREPATAIWRTADGVYSSRVVEPEVRAALAAASRDTRLTPRRLRTAVQLLRGCLEEIGSVEVSAELAHAAGDLAERHALSGFDAVHLASAVLIDADVVATFDRRLARAATREGLAVVPPHM